MINLQRYLPAPSRPPHITQGIFPLGYAGTEKTIESIKDMIRKGAKDFYVRQKAIDILLEAGVQPKDYLGEAQAMFTWVQRNVRYTKDPFEVETLHSARRMLELLAGDCDDMTILLGSMLKSIGHPVRLVLAGFEPGRPEQFTHIYLEVNIRGQWIPLDATMPYAMGWAPPATYRKVFPIEKEKPMMPISNEELQGLLSAYQGEFGDSPSGYQVVQTVDGLGDAGLGRARFRRRRFDQGIDAQITAPTSQPLPWVREFIRRAWRQGLTSGDSQVRELYQLLRSQSRIRRDSWMRSFLTSAYRQGLQPRDERLRQARDQLRAWGLVPPRNEMGQGAPNWYSQPPWWYRRPPAWMTGVQTAPGLPGFQTAPGLPSPLRSMPLTTIRDHRLPFQPAATAPSPVNTLANLVTAPLRTATNVVTAPLRALSSLF